MQYSGALTNYATLLPMAPHTFDAAERAVFRRLATPEKIQRFLDDLAYNKEHDGETCRSPRRVLRDRTAHCMEGALFGAAALRMLGHPPLLLDLEAVRDDDHVLAIFRERGHWGALAKSNYSGLRYREPVYRTLRELAMSYFEHYYNLKREKTLRNYSRPVNLRRFDSTSLDDGGGRCLDCTGIPGDHPAHSPAAAGLATTIGPRRRPAVCRRPDRPRRQLDHGIGCGSGCGGGSRTPRGQAHYQNIEDAQHQDRRHDPMAFLLDHAHEGFRVVHQIGMGGRDPGAEPRENTAPERALRARSPG